VKVLLGADAVGGVLTYAVDLTAGLTRQGVEVAVATGGAPLSTQQREALRRAGAGSVDESALRLEWMADPWDDVAAQRDRLMELADRERVDLVHVNSYAHADADWPVPVVVGAHSCVLSWWRAVHGVDAPPQWDRYRQAVAAGLRRADAVVAPTAAMLQALGRLHGPLPDPAVVVPNGSSARDAAPHGPKEPFVLGAGRLWDAAKNLAALDEAADGLGYPVLVAGALADADGVAVAPRAARAVGQLAPARLTALRRRASVFAAPARYEPFGLAALEAARDACALVLGDIPSLREVWGDAAVYVDPDDPAALRRALRTLLDAPAMARAAGLRAQRRAARYTVEAMTAGHLALYGRLVSLGVPA
jgi:glycosyltransferase involved in cell wall biosynthesis